MMPIIKSRVLAESNRSRGFICYRGKQSGHLAKCCESLDYARSFPVSNTFQLAVLVS